MTPRRIRIALVALAIGAGVLMGWGKSAGGAETPTVPTPLLTRGRVERRLPKQHREREKRPVRKVKRAVRR